jgi:hypothetical protein
MGRHTAAPGSLSPCPSPLREWSSPWQPMFFAAWIVPAGMKSTSPVLSVSGNARELATYIVEKGNSRSDG